ncbi:MAG: efflux RND transporter permease subunit [Cyanobacteria bacterium SZAS LIN-3]|nr:efflux RND transporter permease subunit [Cyanobacteria bacterium SZAS LIN-3]
MWIVQLALRKGHTFVVLSIAIVIFGVLSIAKMAIDIFPVIDSPVVSCVWTYAGLSPYYMAYLVTTPTERALTSTINGIDRMESNSLSGMSIIKIYLQKGTPIGESVAMVTSVGAAVIRQLPRGISPPFVTQSSATDVPVMQLGITSKTLGEAELFDIANNVIRSQLATVQGAITPFPYGGKYRQVMVDIDQQALRATGLSAYDVMEAIKNQNVIAPDGTAKFGEYEYVLVLNNMAQTIDKLNAIPVKTENGAVIFVRDVAFVHDGNQPQLNIVNLNGKRGVLFNILKTGDASTLSVVQRVKEILPRLRAIVPPACKIDIVTDQSAFVRDCVSEVVKEALTAGVLTALMMLALLGSWRSTLIVATSIPLAILSSIIGLNICGQTINSMTLGGLALAVGMLVDDATVEVENVHRNMAMGKDIITAILDGAQQVALPALVSTLSICIVFVPLLFLTEPSRSLFVPLGMAVTFAMLASYGLSRTVVPLMSKTLLGAEGNKHENADSEVPPNPVLAFFINIHRAIDSRFEYLRTRYHGILALALDHPRLTMGTFLGFYACSLALLPFIGEDYFPIIDGGQLRLHVCAHPGTRLEETERVFKRVEKAISTLVDREGDLEGISDNIGLPVSGINFAYSDSQTMSSADGEILVSLQDKRHHPTVWYQKEVRSLMRREFPDLSFYFQPGDIVTQILNAGLPAPIDVRVLGYNKQIFQIASKLKSQIEKIPGACDVSLHQVTTAPHLEWTVDRIKAKELGITQEDVSNSFLISLGSSFQTNPNFWLNRNSGINYNLATQAPQRSLSGTGDLNMMNITPKQQVQTAEEAMEEKSGDQTAEEGKTYAPQLLMNLATYERKATPAVVSHLNVQPVFDIYADCQDRDLGGVAREIVKLIKTLKDSHLPRGVFIFLGGQALSMLKAFVALLLGLIFALILVYLLLVVNFQSWTDPLIILMAIPGALSGILWSLFITQTTFSIPALMGTIMTIGVASANSILMVNFARGELESGEDAKKSALNAGGERFRPVIMTATAMIIGMIPMAIGGGEGGSQNAPIGRAVIGGLMVATLSTLIFVPLMFSLVRGRKSKPTADEVRA